MRDGDEIDGIGAQVRRAGDLDTSLEHAQEKIVCGAYALFLRVAGDVAWSDDGAAESEVAG